jgi:Ion channel
VGVISFLGTIFIHAVPIAATVNFVRYQRSHGRVGVSLWSDLLTVAVAMTRLFVAHLVEIALWAAVFLICGEFHDFGTAYYHSAVNYTTLGYGDIIMSPSWRLLGPLEAANGVLMFGVSTALVFTVIQGLILARFVDLKE